jgi:hypothetical protein
VRQLLVQVARNRVGVGARGGHQFSLNNFDWDQRVPAGWRCSPAIGKALPWGYEKAAGVAWGSVAKCHARGVCAQPSCFSHALWLIKTLWAIV